MYRLKRPTSDTYHASATSDTCRFFSIICSHLALVSVVYGLVFILLTRTSKLVYCTNVMTRSHIDKIQNAASISINAKGKYVGK